MHTIPVIEVIRILDEAKNDAQHVLDKIDTPAYLNLLACERITTVCNILENVMTYLHAQNRACLPSRHLDDNGQTSS